MSTQSEDLERLKLFTERQDSEAKLHWSRNSYFLVVMSILILAFGQKPVEDVFQLALLRTLIAVLGLVLSFVWLLINTEVANIFYTTRKKHENGQNLPIHLRYIRRN